MRGLSSADLSSPQGVLSVLQRIKRETVRFKGWDVLGNVFLASLSFGNYLLWHDVRYKSDRFREHPSYAPSSTTGWNCRKAPSTSPTAAATKRTSAGRKCTCPSRRTARSIPLSTTVFPRVSSCTDLPVRASRRPSPTSSPTTSCADAGCFSSRRKWRLFPSCTADCRTSGSATSAWSCTPTKPTKSGAQPHHQHPRSRRRDDGTGSRRKAAEIAVPLEKLQKELDAMHRKRYLGFSLYEAILDYFANENAPDCLNIDKHFLRKNLPKAPSTTISTC